LGRADPHRHRLPSPVGAVEAFSFQSMRMANERRSDRATSAEYRSCCPRRPIANGRSLVARANSVSRADSSGVSGTARCAPTRGLALVTEHCGNASRLRHFKVSCGPPSRMPSFRLGRQTRSWMVGCPVPAILCMIFQNCEVSVERTISPVAARKAGWPAKS